jgi:long-chain acyl-CoA synthetase
VNSPGFWRGAAARPGRVALVEPDGSEWTAGELHAAGNRVARGLRARGLARGARVAMLLPNGAPPLVLLAGSQQVGFYLTPLNTHLTAREVAHILADSGATAFFAHASFGALAGAAADQAGLAREGRFAVGGALPGFERWESLQAGQSDERPDDRVAGQLLQYTSGTTGRPKGVLREIPPVDPDAMVPLLAIHLARFGIEPGGDGVHLTSSPLYHTAPLVFSWFALHFEHRVVLMDRFDPERALALIERHRVTHTHMVPTQFHRLLLLPEAVRARYDCSSLRQVLHAAAPCPAELKRRMLAWWGPVIWEYYGATEGGGTLIGPEDWLAHPGSVGRPWQGAAVRIVDDLGRDCPPGTAGTVYLKLIQDFAYGGDAAKTRAGRLGDFFTVGDVGILDADGYLTLCDRKIDMIIRGGVNVYPAEVEAVLFQHPKVGDAAVFGIPDDDWGEQVKAAVEPAPGVEPGPALERELLDFCTARLARHKCPRSVDFHAALPRDPSGKLYKRTLRDPYWAGRERAI